MLDIVGVVEDYVKVNGFSVVEDYIGYGVGWNLYEEFFVFNFCIDEFFNVILCFGMILVIEFIFNVGSKVCCILWD